MIQRASAQVFISAVIGMLALWPAALPAGAAAARAARYHVDVWTSDQGLPQNSVNAVLQTRDGYLWLATLDGLARFDGVRFTVFTKATSPGLESNQIISLYEDRDGDLWMGTLTGELTRLRRGAFTTFSARHGLPGLPVRGITGGEDGTLWLLTDSAPMKFADGRCEPALAPDQQARFAPGRSGADSRGASVLEAGGVLRFARGLLTSYGAGAGLPSPRVRGVDEDQYGNVWVLTEDAGLALVRDGRAVRVYTARDGLPPLRPRPGYTIARFVACLDRRGGVWLAGAGTWLGCLRDGALTEYAPPGGARGAVTSILEDAEGNVWVGTDGSGVLRLAEASVTVYSTAEGLGAPNAYPVFEARDGAVWVGTWDKGLSRIADGRVTNYTAADGLPHPLVTALAEDREGRLWVGSYGGVRRFEGGRFVDPGAALDAAGCVVFAILQARDGTFWFGTQRGLVRSDGVTATLVTTADGLAGNDVRVVIEDREGAIWAGSASGLTRYAGGALTSVPGPGGEPVGNVRAIVEDADGALWVGTYDAGLLRIAGGTARRFTTADGLFDDGAFQILEDARGRFWISSNRGIYRVAKHELIELAEGRRQSVASVSYGKRDGMRSVECNGGQWPAGAKTRDGRLWFPTQDGVAVIDPGAVGADRRPPAVAVEECLVGRRRVDGLEPIRVRPGEENLEIHYTGLSLVGSERITFRYRLEGLDRDWVEAGTRRTAYYSHLPPGEYTFTVMAARADDVWGGPGASVRLVVVPPFWRTWWFSSLALVGMAGLGSTWHWRRLARLREEHAAQAEVSRRLMESQEGERKRIAAELHDGLGQSLAIIKNRALLGLRRPEDGAYALEQLREISDASAEVIDEVKEIARSLRPYQLDRFGLTRTLEGMAEKLSGAQDIRVTAEIDRIDGLLPPAAETNVFRIVQECLNNAVAHSGATEVEVRVRRRPGAVEVVVRDNGKGFSPRGAGGPPGRGFGLMGMAERARQIGGSLAVESAPGRGTAVTLSVGVRGATGGD